MSDGEQYLTSFYFTITTITTVGYGDISGGTSAEKIGAIVLMLLGVISFSVASASLSTLFSSYDAGEAALREQM
jgi:voltage-gated potassium channel Kch